MSCKADSAANALPSPVEAALSRQILLRWRDKPVATLAGWTRRYAGELLFTVVLYIAWYNFCRTHLTPRVTPAMKTEITHHIWTLEELIAA